MIRLRQHLLGRDSEGLYSTIGSPDGTVSKGDTVQKLLTRAEVAELLGVPPQTLAEWAVKRRGPIYHRIGKHARYEEVAVLAWLETNRVDPSEKRGPKSRTRAQ